MADPHTSDDRRKPTRKRATAAADTTAAPPCGACKFLRRKCVGGCVFAPHFGSDQGAARFAAVHKVFGASNVSKLLLHIPVSRRNDAVMTIWYEAQARLSDPVYGCVSTILDLQQQVASLQAELAMVQTQLINSRLAVASAFQNTKQQQQQQQQQHQHQYIAVLQPAYSNNSSTSNNQLINTTTFNPSFDLTAETAPSSHSFEPLQPPRRLSQDGEEGEEEEESRDPVAFSNHLLHSR